MNNRKVVLDGFEMTPEELEEYTKKTHPEWFDSEGNRLPTYESGAALPGGIVKKSTDKVVSRTAIESQRKAWKPTLSKPLPPLQCSGTAKNGERCKAFAVAGIEVCMNHGGSTPRMQARAQEMVTKARMSLFNLSEDAVDVIQELMLPGVSDAIRLKAAQDVLDRTGLKTAIDINVEVEHKSETPAEAIARKLEKLSSRNKEDEEDTEDIVDAEIIDPFPETDDD